jgi:hypothetical protein
MGDTDHRPRDALSVSVSGHAQNSQLTNYPHLVLMTKRPAVAISRVALGGLTSRSRRCARAVFLMILGDVK